MQPHYKCVCGVDVHKEFLQVCILKQEEDPEILRVFNNFSGLRELKQRVEEAGCECIACESTGVYWYRLYLAFEGQTRVIVGNAYQIKSIPGRKTDVRDAQWIAELALNGLINPSRVFPKNDRELRELTRTRESTVHSRTQIKNRIHRIFDSAGIALGKGVKDIFGKSGIHLIWGLLNREDTENIIGTIPSARVKKNADVLREILSGSLSDLQILLLKKNLDMMAHINEHIHALDEQIVARISEQDRVRDIEIACSIPGVSVTTAVTVLAEIGDYRDFKKAERLASWAGLVPSVYQSAGKNYSGKITKHGSEHLRWILVQAAKSAGRTVNSSFRKFFTKISYRSGGNTATVALARKILCILWHLLINRELYIDPINDAKSIKPPVVKKFSKNSPTDVQQAIDFIVKSGFKVIYPDSILEQNLRGVHQ
ncbi:MAG: IS110 family transposase [Methanoregula sp.]